MGEQDNKQEWHDDGLGSLYRKAHQEQPSAESDRAVLEAARKVGVQQQRSRLYRWTVPLATAASLLLVVNLVWFNYDWQAPMQQTFEEEKMEAPAKIEQLVKQQDVIAEHRPQPVKPRREKEALTHERKLNEQRAMSKMKGKQVAEQAQLQKEMQSAESSPKLELFAPAETSSSAADDIASLYGMGHALNNYYTLQLAADYQPVDGRHFITIDFNADGISDWAGLLKHRQGHIELLAIISHKQTYRHHVLDKGVVKPDQLADSGIQLKITAQDKSADGLPELVVKLPDQSVKTYRWDEKHFIRHE